MQAHTAYLNFIYNFEMICRYSIIAIYTTCFSFVFSVRKSVRILLSSSIYDTDTILTEPNLESLI